MIHFVYAVPPPRVGRAATAFKLYRRLADVGVSLPYWYRYGWLPGIPKPLPAPGSITAHLSTYLRQYQPLRLYNLDEVGQIECSVDDIILGHPHPDTNTIIQRTFASAARCRMKALIFPMHHAMPAINQFALPLIEKADKVIGIMGPYWKDTLDQSLFAPWKDKIMSLDMAVDGTEYPYVKKRFNPPGRRGYLYIGSSSDRPEKGCDVLGKTMAYLQDVPKGWIGSGPDIPSMKRIATYASLTPEFVASLAEEYDFFVNMSLSDANPTTILEAMAWGFPVACTPESGYYKIPMVTTLSTTDLEKNAKLLLELQYAPEDRLRQLSFEGRCLVERQYSWDRFCSTVWRELKPYV